MMACVTVGDLVARHGRRKTVEEILEAAVQDSRRAFDTYIKTVTDPEILERLRVSRDAADNALRVYREGQQSRA